MEILVPKSVLTRKSLFFSNMHCVLSFSNGRYYHRPLCTSHNLNNTYLNLNGQEQGTKSYGMVVDLLIAEYKELADEIN